MTAARSAAASAGVTAGFVLALTLAGCVSDAALVTSTFDTSAEGWVVSGDTGMADVGFHADGGHPGGYITGDDEALGETWYFRAPEGVLAQLPAAEGGTLAYSLKQSETDAGFLEDDVVIEGPAGRLSYRFDYAPGTDWTEFSVRLSADAGWRWNWNAPATPDQMHSVLTNPTRLQIRGEYRTGPDEGGLDDVRLSAGD